MEQPRRSRKRKEQKRADKTRKKPGRKRKAFMKVDKVALANRVVETQKDCRADSTKYGYRRSADLWMESTFMGTGEDSRWKPEVWDFHLPNPRLHLTESNMSQFFQHVYDCSKKGTPAIAQHKKWLQQQLGRAKMPRLRAHQKTVYPKVWDTLEGLKTKPKCAKYETTRAEPLRKDSFKQILSADFRNPDRTINREALRAKVGCSLLLLCGFRPKGVYDLNENHVTLLPNEVDEDGKLCPKVTVVNVETKDPSRHPRNALACSCKDGHDPKDEKCLYNLFRIHEQVKQNDLEYWDKRGCKRVPKEQERLRRSKMAEQRRQNAVPFLKEKRKNAKRFGYLRCGNQSCPLAFAARLKMK